MVRKKSSYLMYCLIVFALAMILAGLLIIQPLIIKLSISGHYPVELWGYVYDQRYTDGTTDAIQHNLMANTYMSTSNLQMPFANAKAYATVQRYFWIFKTGETQVSVQLGKDWTYGLSITHGDANLLTNQSAIWQYESSYAGAMGENPKTIAINYWVKNETIDANTTRVYYETVTYKIYRFWSTVTVSTFGEEPIVKVEYGTLDASMMKNAIGNALMGINSISHLGPVTDPSFPDPGGTRNAAFALRLAIDPMAISSNADWYGFLGAWVAGNGPQKSGTVGGSTANLAYEHPHDVMAMYKEQGNPLTLPYYTSPGTERAYRTFDQYPSLDQYTIDQLKNIPKDMLSNVVLLPINIVDFGVTYSAKDGDPANPNSFISYGGRVSNTLSYIFDVLTTSNSTWYQDYVKPESTPVANAGNIKGVTYDDSGHILRGVTVQTVDISGYSSTSGSDGSYYIENVPNGEHMLKASKAGYEDTYVSVVVDIGLTTVRDITLTPTPNPWGLLLTTVMVVFIAIVIVAVLYYYMKFKAIRGAGVRGVAMTGIGGIQWHWIIIAIAAIVCLFLIYLIVKTIVPWWW